MEPQLSSNSPRNGKIARLPRSVRHALNLRLDDGMEGDPLLGWLHHQPSVMPILRELFDCRPITKQNLSE